MGVEIFPLTPKRPETTVGKGYSNRNRNSSQTQTTVRSYFHLFQGSQLVGDGQGQLPHNRTLQMKSPRSVLPLFASLAFLAMPNSGALASAAFDDCSTCNGTLTSPAGTVTDPSTGSYITLSITQVANGTCTNECAQDTQCSFRFKQKIYIGGVGGTITYEETSIFGGQISTSSQSSPQMPSGLAADDDLRQGARCGEVRGYTVSLDIINSDTIEAGALYQCSDCTAPA